MIPLRFKAFINTLIEKTETNEVIWYEGADDVYACDHKNHTLYLHYRFDDHREQAFYIFRIMTDGKITPFTVVDDDSDFDKMKQLYEAVVANANNVDEVIKDFFG